ncbi:MAG: AMP-binding protein, partial [Thermoleophilia bacterium]|nr:AMP-binding protein [Thermoleophilia bacterium]
MAEPMHLANLLTETVRQYPDQLALCAGDSRLSYAALGDEVARLGGWLIERGGITPGDRVAIMLPNVPEFVIIYHAVQRAGGIIVPMNVLLRQREIAFYLSDSGASLAFVWEGFVGEARAGAEAAGVPLQVVGSRSLSQLPAPATRLTTTVERADVDTAVILYTSGTTGTPKGAELTHANMVRNARVSQSLFALNESDAVLGALPLFH